jgi:hypothetical protein
MGRYKNKFVFKSLGKLLKTFGYQVSIFICILFRPIHFVPVLHLCFEIFLAGQNAIPVTEYR